MECRLNAQLVLSALVVLIVIITQCFVGVDSFECTVRRGGILHAPLERFQCPRYRDKRDEMFCCGNELNRYCCKRSKAIHHSFGHAGARGLLYSGLVVLLIIGGCIVGCCLCCYWMVKRRKGTRGTVLSTNEPTIGGQSVHMVNQPPQPMVYPNQPSYGTPMYPPQPGFTQSYPYPSYPPSTDNPPAYFAATNAPPVDTKLPPFNPNYPH